MNRFFGIAALAAYIATIWVANYLVSHYGIVSVGFGLMAPAAVYAVGVAFTARDVTQRLLGRAAAVGAIVAGSALSYLLGADANLGGHATVAVASGAAFLLSEGADMAIYTPLARRRWLTAVVASNIVGAFIDSAVFLWLAFGSLAFWQGQVVGKLSMTAAAVALIAGVRALRAVRA